MTPGFLLTPLFIKDVIVLPCFQTGVVAWREWMYLLLCLEIQHTLFCRGLSSHTWRMQAQPVRNVTSTVGKVEHEW